MLEATVPGTPADRIVIAVPKGRILRDLGPRLASAGIETSPLEEDDRRLVRDSADGSVRYLLLKPDDVPTYVEYGAADLGVVGRDVLMERDLDVYVPVDLGIGRCRMVVAGPPGAALDDGGDGRPLRVATKFPNTATRHFLGRGRQVETIFVQGSVELAPLTGLADLIVDLVETGETLRENGLVEIEDVCAVSSVVVANRVGLKLKRATIAPLLAALQTAP